MMASRIKEMLMMCDRDNPIYDQISNYSIALYALGYIDAPDLMAVDDLDMGAASEILKTEFEPIDVSEIPGDYTLMTSGEKYLLVVGDPMFPLHFAALVDTKSDKPFFSKPGYLGSGYDNLQDLLREIPVDNGTPVPDLHYFKSA